MNMKVLIVEDDSDINELLCSILIKRGYFTRSAFSGTEALMCVEQEEYDIVLLDMMLPGASGEDVISSIREKKMMPIIVISAKAAQEDKINALKLGADDYICKPFDINEVIARIEAQLRRYKTFSRIEDSTSAKLICKDLVLDTESKQVFLKEREVILTLREFSILELLMNSPNKVFTRENIFESVWNNEFLGDDNTVNVHISNLRAKLNKIDRDTEYIKTVWGIGFKLNQ